MRGLNYISRSSSSSYSKRIVNISSRWGSSSAPVVTKSTTGESSSASSMSSSSSATITATAPAGAGKEKTVGRGSSVLSRMLKRRRPSVSSVGMWDRVVPASSKMMEFLDNSSAAPSREPSFSISSALQLIKFYLSRSDLKSAKEVLFSVERKQKNLTVSHPLLNPLFDSLLRALCEANDMENAMVVAQYMSASGQGALKKETLLVFLEYCQKHKRPDLVSRLLKSNAAESLITSLVSQHLDVCTIMLELSSIGSWKDELSKETLWSILRALVAVEAPSHVHVRTYSALLNAAASPTSVLDIVHEYQATKDNVSDMTVPLEAAQLLIGKWQDLEGVDKLLRLFPTLQEKCSASLFRCIDGKGSQDSEIMEFLKRRVAYDETSVDMTMAYAQATLKIGEDSAAIEAALESLRKALTRRREDAQTILGEVSSAESSRLLIDLCLRFYSTDNVRDDEKERLRDVIGQVRERCITEVFRPTPFLNRALLHCSVVQGHLGRTVALLHRLQREKEAVQQEDYEAVLRAFEQVAASPSSYSALAPKETHIVQDPLQLLTWIVEESHPPCQVTSTIVKSALAILARACEVGPLGRREAFIQKAVGLVSKLAASGQETDDGICEALLRVTVQSTISLNRAKQIVRQMEDTGAAPLSLARVYHLLIGSLAERGELLEAESLLVKMLTVTGERPSEVVMDAFARAYLREGNVPSGLSMIQGCFTQYSARPSKSAYLELFQTLLSGDASPNYEALRALTIAQQLWSEQEHAGFLQELESKLTK